MTRQKKDGYVDKGGGKNGKEEGKEEEQKWRKRSGSLKKKRNGLWRQFPLERR